MIRSVSTLTFAFSLSAGLVLTLVPSVLVAQTSPQPAPGTPDENARAAFQEGQVAFEEGRFEEALEHFSASYALSQRPELLFNMGSANDRLRRNEAALGHFQRYLSALPSAENRPEVEGRIRILQAELSAEADAEAAAVFESRNQAAAPGDEPGVAERWWFWTLIGALLIGGTVGAILIAGGDSIEAPLEGNVGPATSTLQVRFP